MKLAIKWLLGLAIGVLFLWLAARAWPVDKIFQYPIRLEGTYLIAGTADPQRDQYLLERSTLVNKPIDRPGPVPATVRPTEGRRADDAPDQCTPDSSPVGAPSVRGLPGGAYSQPAPSVTTLKSDRPQPQGWYFNLLHLIPYFAFLVVIHFLRVIRWYPLLRPLAKVGFWELNRVGAVGFMAVFLFPLRLGELVRPYLLANTVRASASLATIVVERVFDGLMTSLLLFVTLVFLPRWNQESYATISLGAFISLAVFVGCLAFLALAYWRREWTVRLVRRMVGRASRRVAERVISILEAFLQGLSVLPSWRNLAQFCALTAIYWAINGVGLYLFCRGFGIHIPLLGAYAMMTCVVVGMMIPNSPGNVGSFWYFLLMPLALYGVDADNLQATVCGLFIWSAQFLQLTLFGAYFMVTGQVTWRSIWRATKAHGEPAAVGAASDSRATSADGA